MNRLAKLMAELIDAVSCELHAIRTPRTLQEMASGLASIPAAKDETKARPAVIPNFLDARAEHKPEHAAFDELWYQARTAILRDTALEADFRALATAVIQSAKDRVSEAEMARWPFKNTLVSPSFIREVLERKGL